MSYDHLTSENTSRFLCRFIIIACLKLNDPKNVNGVINYYVGLGNHDIISHVL